jgi:hypothetical protein
MWRRHRITLSELTARPVGWRHGVAFGDRALYCKDGTTRGNVDRPNNWEYD